MYEIHCRNVLVQSESIQSKRNNLVVVGCACYNTYTFACRFSCCITVIYHTNARQYFPIQRQTIWFLQIFIATDERYSNLSIQKWQIASATILIVAWFEVDLCK